MIEVLMILILIPFVLLIFNCCSTHVYRKNPFPIPEYTFASDMLRSMNSLYLNNGRKTPI